jgi:hypothetical protein
MASQIAHIIYARKYFEKNPALPNFEDEFMLGCVFPDIRRIDESIKRKDTHRCFSPLDLNFSSLSAFQAGWKFHLYCDMRREEILNSYKFYEIPGTADFWHQSAKQLEDELLYGEYNNWEKVVHYFNNVPMLEIGVGVTRETFQLWYAIIAKYIEKKPDSKAMHIFLSKQPSFAAKADDIIKSVDKLRKNEKVIELLGKVKEEII